MVCLRDTIRNEQLYLRSHAMALAHKMQSFSLCELDMISDIRNRVSVDHDWSSPGEGEDTIVVQQRIHLAHGQVDLVEPHSQLFQIRIQFLNLLER